MRFYVGQRVCRKSYYRRGWFKSVAERRNLSVDQIYTVSGYNKGGDLLIKELDNLPWVEGFWEPVEITTTDLEDWL